MLQFHKARKLVGLVKSIFKKNVTFLHECSSIDTFTESLLDFSTIPNLFYIIYKMCSIMYLANCKVVPKIRGRRWLCYYLFITLHFSERIWVTNDELISNFLHWSYLFHSKLHCYELITKGLELRIMAFEPSIYKYCKIWIINQDNEQPLIRLYYYYKISMTLGKLFTFYYW